MSEPVGRTAEVDDAPALEDAVEDRLGEIRIVKDLSPGVDRLIRRENHGSAFEVALVDDLEEHVGRIRWMDEVADLVDHEDRDRDQGMECFGEASVTAGDRELVDEFVGGRKVGLEAVLDRTVGDRNRQRRLPRARRAGEDHSATLADELRTQVASQEPLLDGFLEGPVELFNRLEERKLRATDGALNPGLRPVGDLLGDEEREVVAEGELILLRARLELGVEPPHRREVEAAEHRVEVEAFGERAFHAGSLTSWATYSAPKSRRRAASRTAPRRRGAPTWPSRS